MKFTKVSKGKDLKQWENKDSPPFNMEMDCNDSEINENKCSKVIETIIPSITSDKTKTVTSTNSKYEGLNQWGKENLTPIYIGGAFAVLIVCIGCAISYTIVKKSKL